MRERALVWRRVGRGLLVIGFGVFLLLNTTGFLPWSFWRDLLPFWPVILVAIGLRLVFERGPVPAAVLLSPLLILATMSWVAISGPAYVGWRGRTVPVRAERPDDIQRWTLEGSVTYGSLDLAGRVLDPSMLVEGRARAARHRPELRTSGGRGAARVRFRTRSERTFILFWSPWTRWDLDVAEDLPVTLDLDLALSDVRLDLDRVPLSTFETEAVFSDLDLTLGRPDREVYLSLKGAFTSYELTVPSGVPVRVENDGAFNLVDGRRSGRTPGYRIRLDGAFNKVRVRNR
jgi:hypothetical protein